MLCYVMYKCLGRYSGRYFYNKVFHNNNNNNNNISVHSFHVKWVKCAKEFRKIEGQQIRQVVSLTERCTIEG